MSAQTLDQLGAAKTVARPMFQDTDLTVLGYGNAPTPSYRARLDEIAAYIQTKLGTSQTRSIATAGTPPFHTSDTMGTNDFELATSVPMNAPITLGLVPASSASTGQRRRIVDLVGAINGSNIITISPSGSDKINGVNATYLMRLPFSRINLESDGVGGWAIVEQGPSLLGINNLSDLQSIPTARANLGLGTAALQNSPELLQSNRNLSDLTSPTVARGNLGLRSLAVLDQIAYGNISQAAIAAAWEILTNYPQLLLTTEQLWGAQQVFGLTFATNKVLDFNTFINGWLVLTQNCTLSVTGVGKLGQTGTLVVQQDSVGGHTVGWPSVFHWPSRIGNTAIIANPVLTTSAWAVNIVKYVLLSNNIDGHNTPYFVCEYLGNHT